MSTAADRTGIRQMIPIITTAITAVTTATAATETDNCREKTELKGE